MYDVVVVGGGPVGSQAAFRLSKAGYHVAVIEKKKDYHNPVCCTGIISEECFLKYRIDPTVVYRHVNCASFYSPCGIQLRVKRAEPQAVILNRTAFNQYMAQRAQEQGAVYFPETQVIQLKILPEAVAAVSDRPQDKIFSARIIIIATGASIPLLKTINLRQPPVFAAGAQAEVETHDDVTGVEVYTGQNIAPGYFAWLVPTSEGKALAGLLAYRRPAEYLKQFMAQLRTMGKIVSSKVPIISGAVPVRAIPQSYSGRILVAGTTAGMVKPTTGGGIYYGLLSADTAVDIIQQAFAVSDFRKSRFATYQHEWKKALGKELRMGSRTRMLYERLSDANIDRIFDIINKNSLMDKLMANEDVSFDWHSNAVRHLIQETTLAKLLKGVKLFFPGK